MVESKFLIFLFFLAISFILTLCGFGLVALIFWAVEFLPTWLFLLVGAFVATLLLSVYLYMTFGKEIQSD